MPVCEQNDRNPGITPRDKLGVVMRMAYIVESGDAKSVDRFPLNDGHRETLRSVFDDALEKFCSSEIDVAKICVQDKFKLRQSLPNYFDGLSDIYQFSVKAESVKINILVSNEIIKSLDGKYLVYFFRYSLTCYQDQIGVHPVTNLPLEICLSYFGILKKIVDKIAEVYIEESLSMLDVKTHKMKHIIDIKSIGLNPIVSSRFKKSIITKVERKKTGLSALVSNFSNKIFITSWREKIKNYGKVVLGDLYINGFGGWQDFCDKIPPNKKNIKKSYFEIKEKWDKINRNNDDKEMLRAITRNNKELKKYGDYFIIDNVHDIYSIYHGWVASESKSNILRSCFFGYTLSDSCWDNEKNLVTWKWGSDNSDNDIVLPCRIASGWLMTWYVNRILSNLSEVMR